LYAYFTHFEDLLLIVPNSLLIAGFFDSDKTFFFRHSRNCFLLGEAVNSFAQLAVDCYASSVGTEHFAVR